MLRPLTPTRCLLFLALVSCILLFTLAPRYDLLNNEERVAREMSVRRADSIFDDALTPKSKFFKISTRLLFYLPSLYYAELHKVDVDRTVHYGAWRRFMIDVEKDWQNSVTPVRVHIFRNLNHVLEPTTTGDSHPLH